MNILSLEDASKQYGERPLFQQVSFGLNRGERVGMIGVNGSGKTSLLRIVAGLELPDTGRVVTASGIRIAYLPQTPLLDEGQSVLDAVFSTDSPTIRLLRVYEQTVEALVHSPDDPTTLARLNELTPQMDAAGAWEAETAARTVISRLGLAEYTVAPVGTLSGGLRKRVAMAQALIEQPDLLILDEPTNHIDTDTVTWLEEYLSRIPCALLLVTHDRYFLDRLVSRMIELDRGRVYSYNGNYARFLEQKAEREAHAAAAEEARQNLLRKELAWLRRGARARTTKQKAHVQRVYDLMEQRPGAAQGTVDIDLGSRRIGKRVLELRQVSKSFDDRPVIKDFSLELRPDDRLGIIGPNGSGKTTLLNMIAGRVVPDAGQVVLGETVHLAYYDQESAGLDESLRVIDYVREAAEMVRGKDGALVAASQMLERFLFPPDAQWALIATLSGGERRRLYLLRTLMFAPNLLLLDEPTNDLDIQTLTVLEDYLDTFKGAVIAVSHDRYFLDRTAQRLLAFEENGSIRAYPGGYSTREEFRARAGVGTPGPVVPTPRLGVKTTVPDISTPTAPRKLTYKERRELAQIEERIAAMEVQKEALAERLNAAGSDYQAYQRLAAELAQLDAELERAVERWAELAEVEG